MPTAGPPALLVCRGGDGRREGPGPGWTTVSLISTTQGPDLTRRRVAARCTPVKGPWGSPSSSVGRRVLEVSGPQNSLRSLVTGSLWCAASADGLADGLEAGETPAHPHPHLLILRHLDTEATHEALAPRLVGSERLHRQATRKGVCPGVGTAPGPTGRPVGLKSWVPTSPSPTRVTVQVSRAQFCGAWSRRAPGRGFLPRSSREACARRGQVGTRLPLRASVSLPGRQVCVSSAGGRGQ